MAEVRLVTENLLAEMVGEMKKSSAIYILTSFVMYSGVRLLEPHLKEAIERGAEVKVLAGDYLFVTQPHALQALLDIDPRMEVRLWRSGGTAFHPKAYLLQYEDNDGVLIVGSSNMSRSAFTYGVEWNLAMQAKAAPMTFEEAQTKFMHLFYHEQTVSLNRETCLSYAKEYDEYHRLHPSLVKTWTETEEIELTIPVAEYAEEQNPFVLKEAIAQYGGIVPRPAQQIALEELEKTMSEGYDKAMVVMATGLGKTYLAAFFARNFNRVLFIAHREELLYQARRSFAEVMPERTCGIYDGQTKERQADSVFASIYTLSMKRHLEMFRPDEFDLIIVDEFHHAAANSYRRVLDYFQPAFLLGITATPYRTDGKDVYAICDGNVAFQLDFIEAVQRGWLAPFRYYGVYDDTDYSQITWLGTRYDEEELLQAQLKEEMAAKIYAAWNKHKQTRTLAFCSSIRQADFLKNFFQNQGVRALSLHSKTREMSRSEAIRQMEKGELEIIFTVDLFNEGTDIPSVDTLLFVRPTESLTIFTQQVGRGLRLYPSKEYCTIIDLIGNYRNADVKLSLFDTRTGTERKNHDWKPVVPFNCSMELETGVINLLQEMARKTQPRKEKLLQAFEDVKRDLGRIPTYLELHLYGRENSREYRQEFKSYIRFLDWAGQLSEQESELLRKYEHWLNEVEATGMAKSYKMIVLLYMLNRGEQRWHQPVTPQEVAPFFYRYLTEKEFRKRIDFSDKSSQKLWTYNEEQVAKLIAEMPMSKWSGSSKGLVTFTDGVFSLNFDIDPQDSPILYRWTKDICLYRLHYHFEKKAGDQIERENA
ncbi:DEAD/DEAH box helicase family protein [Brevibacillus thermoruber]|uniref:DEAD/DEAH box helicase family protein n=1 Tax=Brevibacillus thermoruber TaxID=33942 RepID=UPI000419DB35|nr:DEAD/DEAH box helicase family protein [Brevibacillus thermoruber]